MAPMIKFFDTIQESQSIKKVISLDSLLLCVFFVSVLQALIGSLTSVAASYLMPLFLSFLFFVFKENIFRKEAFLNIFVSFFGIMLVVIYLVLSPVELPIEGSYQINFFFSFLLISFFSSSVITRFDGVYNKYFNFCVLFFIISLIIHFFFWESVAQKFYVRDNDFGGLYLDGTYRRFYSLLLNPLSVAFFSIISFSLLVILRAKGWLIYLLLTLLVILSLSRASLFSLIFLWLILFIERKKYKLIFFYCILLFCVVFIFEPIRTMAVQALSFSDNTGSSDEHLRNIQIGFDSFFSFAGEGFVSAIGFGGWNVRLESTPFQFGFTGGFFSALSVFFLYLFSYFMIYVKYGLVRSVAFLAVLPIFIFFPLHTFSLPVVMFSILCNSWQFKIKKN